METTAELLYSGCASIPSTAGISKIKPDGTTAASFFAEYVATRTPVQFAAQSEDLASTSLWTDAYLARKCSDCKIKVEVREAGGHYGKGNEIRTTFGEFLEKVRQGRTYLTTQDLEYDEDGRPAIVSPPVTCLEEDIPPVPSLFSNLIVANVNMWFGHTTDGKPTTSGLHHDFHDNLYILLRGEKKITLISPAEAENLYTVGRISKVHANGRINYHGQAQTRADGSDLAADAALKASQRLQAVAERLAQAGAGAGVARSKEGAADGAGSGNESDDLEDALDRALEDVLDAEMMGEDDYSDEDGEDQEDEDDEEGGSDEDRSGSESGSEGDVGEDSDEDSADGAGSDDDDPDQDEGEESDADEEDGSQLRRAKDLLGKGLRSALAAAAAKNKDSTAGSKRSAADSAPRGDGKKPRGEAAANGSAQVYSETSSAPVSFSRVDTSLPASVLQEHFPLFAQVLARGAAHEVTLKAGEMLYIPAGWFHEVRSRSVPSSSSGGDCYDAERGGHLALNYWFHPPDGHEFERPYSSDFWKLDNEQRRAT